MNLYDKRTWILVKRNESELHIIKHCYFEKDVKELIKEIIEEDIYKYPVEFILEAETEANVKDVLNDIAQRIIKRAGKELIDSSAETEGACNPSKIHGELTNHNEGRPESDRKNIGESSDLPVEKTPHSNNQEDKK